MERLEPDLAGTAVVDLLMRTTLFAGLSRLDLAKLAAYLEPQAVPAGAEVVRQGEPGDTLYVVARGRFMVSIAAADGGGAVHVGGFGPGELFGEMALLSGEPRSATVRAEDDGLVLRLEREQFLELLRRDPSVSLSIAAELSRRLRSAHQVRLRGEQVVAASLGQAPDDGRGGVGFALDGVTTDGESPRMEGARSGSGSAANRRLATGLALASAATAVLAAVVAVWQGVGTQWVFVALLVAASALLLSRSVPDFAAGLALVAGWIVLGVATPAEALGGFASEEWLFVVGVYGLAAACARSGLLYRIGLFLVRRLPHGLFWQTGALVLTGLVLTPLVPSSTGRASLGSPLALAVAETLRLPPRSRSAALLGLGAWLGAGPLAFAVLNGSGTNLVAWGLLPAASRARFTWLTWLLAAAPLGLFLCLAGLGLLFVLLRPDAVAPPSRQRLNLQVAVLGPLSRRELATLAVLLVTVLGWAVGPQVGLDLATVGLLGLLGAVAVGSFDQRAFQALDWSFLVFFGVVLGIGRLGVAIGLDRSAAAALSQLLGTLRPSPLAFVLAVAGLSTLVRLVLPQDLAVLLGSLVLVPVAGLVGVDPWLAAIALLATSVAWLFPAQTTSYLAAYAASEERLFSHAQARRFAVGYTVLTLLGLALMLPYWHLIGLV